MVGLTLPPGEHDFICTIPGHREAGMVGKLITRDVGEEGVIPPQQETAVTHIADDGVIEANPAADAVLTLRDIRFDPPELQLPALVTSVVEVVNAGDAPHNLTIPDLGISVDVPPGETRTIKITPPTAGRWEMFCDIPGHREAGMVGVLVAK